MERYPMVRKCLSVGIILLFLGTSIIPTVAKNVEKTSHSASRGDWLYVGGSGPGNYTKIQDAINASSDGDTVFVYEGIYQQKSIMITKAITLLGQNKNTTFISGDDNESVIVVLTDFVNISSFMILHGGNGQDDAGIDIRSSNTTIHNNIIKNIHNGILITSSDNNHISGTIITSNTYSGIWLKSSNFNSINTCSVYNNTWGLYLRSSTDNVVTNCNFNNSILYGIVLDQSANNNTFTYCNVFNNMYYGVSQYESNNSQFINCNIYNNVDIGLVLAYSSHNNSISNCSISNHSLFNIAIIEGSGNHVVNCRIINSSNGIQVRISASYNMISGNTITTNNYYGVILENTCCNNIISRNTIQQSGIAGIKLRFSSNNNRVLGNSVSSNIYGIALHSSNNNTLYHNNLINNSANAAIEGDIGTNSWDNGYPSGGNFWDDYTGVDYYSGSGQNISGPDGIGDTPYDIYNDTNTDRYPLMTQWIGQPPIANFTYIKNELSVMFNGTSSYDTDGSISLWLWDFGDGSSGTGETITHQYLSPGIYSVKLTIIDDDYYDDCISQKITAGKYQRGFLFGKITNVSNEGEYLQCNAAKIRVITFLPFSFHVYKSGEIFIISKDYLGFIGVHYIFAWCKSLT